MKPQPLIEMHALRIFIVAAQERNMSTAAARLGISQSAVSQTIRNLENQVGAILVNRNERPLSLTPAGHVLAERGAGLLDDVIDLAGTVADHARGVNPDIRLGLVDSFAATCGSRLARALAARTTRLAVRTGLTPTLGRQLLARELDIIVSSDPLEDAGAVVRYELFSEPFVAVIPRPFRQSRSTVQNLRTLAGRLPLIRFNAGSHLGMQIEAVVRRHEIRSPALLEFDTSDTLTAMVSEGLGWALTTPLCALQAEHLSQNADIAPIDDLTGTRSIYLVARADQHPAFVEETVALCRQLLAKDLLPRLDRMHPGLAARVTVCPG